MPKKSNKPKIDEKLLDDTVAAVQLIQRRLQEAYGDDSQMIITTEGVNLDDAEGGIIVDQGTPERAVTRLLEDAGESV